MEQPQRKLSIDNALDPAQESFVKKSFELYDFDDDGRIKVEDVPNLLRGLGQNMTPEEVEELIAKVGLSDNGTLDYNKFKAVLEAHMISYAQTHPQELNLDAFTAESDDNSKNTNNNNNNNNNNNSSESS